MNRLTEIEIEGFKSIRKMRLKLEPLNVLIGANGAGKSNFISFFRLLNAIVSEKLQEYIGRSGGATSLLYYGPQETEFIRSKLFFSTEKEDSFYSFGLFYSPKDTLVFIDEHYKVFYENWKIPLEFLFPEDQPDQSLHSCFFQ